MMIYVNNRFKPRKKSKRVLVDVARKLDTKKIGRTERPKMDYSHYRPGYVRHESLESDAYFMGKASVMDPRELERESKEVREEIIAKSKRIAIAFNKGAYQYVTEGTDPKTLGSADRLRRE